MAKDTLAQLRDFGGFVVEAGLGSDWLVTG